MKYFMLSVLMVVGGYASSAVCMDDIDAFLADPTHERALALKNLCEATGTLKEVKIRASLVLGRARWEQSIDDDALSTEEATSLLQEHALKAGKKEERASAYMSLGYFMVQAGNAEEARENFQAALSQKCLPNHLCAEVKNQLAALPAADADGE